MCIYERPAGASLDAHIAFMDRMIAAATAADELGPAIETSGIDPFLDGLRDVKLEIFTNVALAITGVFVVCLALLGSLRGAALVAGSLVFIDACVLGAMMASGEAFNYVTGINLVIAVGLSVDPVAHTCHAFLRAEGTGDERATHALRTVGTAVANGTISTLLVLLPLAFARQYIFITFVKTLALIISFSAWFGLVFLPVVLSVLGPSSYAQRRALDPPDSKGDKGAAMSVNASAFL